MEWTIRQIIPNIKSGNPLGGEVPCVTRTTDYKEITDVVGPG